MLCRICVIDSETEPTLSFISCDTTSRLELEFLIVASVLWSFFANSLKLSTTVRISFVGGTKFILRVKSASPDAISERAFAVSLIGRTIPRRIKIRMMNITAKSTTKERTIIWVVLFTNEFVAAFDLP